MSNQHQMVGNIIDLMKMFQINCLDNLLSSSPIQSLIKVEVKHIEGEIQ